MRLPKDILTKTATKPNVYLCEVDKTKICKLTVSDLKGDFKFNGLSEISFEVGRTYNDAQSGTIKVNPYYDKIESLRLIYLEGFGYFELQGPELMSDGIKEAKSCKAYSLEYTLTQKYLADFYINQGTTNSLEVLNAASEKEIVPISLYNPTKPKLSLLHLILEGIYGWKIGHIDKQLQTLSRQFEIDRESVYDFIINEICEKFNCYVVFDTIGNTINLYAESPTAKFIADGQTKVFEIKDSSNSHPFSTIETVSVDGYKTTRYTYTYSNEVGTLVLEDTPEYGVMIEVIGIDSTWETDVFVSFDNLSQEATVSYDADSIKTKLTVTYGDDADIREVNLGSPHLIDLSYYYTVDWMGQDLYDAYTLYVDKSNASQINYTNNSKEISKFNDYIAYEENRLSLEYSLAIVGATTVGTYYTRHQNADGSYYYSAVSLPSEYKTGTDYYSNETANLTETKVTKLHSALRSYFYGYFNNSSESIDDAVQELNSLSNDFKFMNVYTLSYLIDKIQSSKESDKEEGVYNFLQEMWNEIGKTPLSSSYLPSYQLRKQNSLELGWSVKDSQYYGFYYVDMLFVDSIDKAIAQRDSVINGYKNERKVFEDANAEISNSLSMDQNFTEGQLIRLSAFLREDELKIDDIVETNLDDLASSIKLKQDAKESGRIELKKICQPQLQFSMDMANIYALPEFEPIIDQFQLGNIIKVSLRPDYIKQSRLLEVSINFDDFSDFSCEFGELTSLRTQSDIHADLLANAISAGKSVAANNASWTRGSDLATATDLKIQQGLLDATTVIKSMDGTQGVVIDKNGILLQKYNPDGSVDPKQARIINNMILMTDDGWKTSRTGLGEFVISDQNFYGILAEAIFSGYIEGTEIKGGIINIGNGAFMVDEFGNVTMNASSAISGYATSEDVDRMIQNNLPTIVDDTQPNSVEKGQLWVDTSVVPNTLKVWDGQQWVSSNYQTAGVVHTSRPSKYVSGDIWILSAGESYGSYGPGTILKADDKLSWVDATPAYTKLLNETSQYFTFDDTEGLKIGQNNQKFYVNITSQKMGFHDVSDGNDNEVVYISNKSAYITKAEFEGETQFNGHATFDQDATFNQSATFKQQMTIKSASKSTGFVWQVESNGSLSLTIQN